MQLFFKIKQLLTFYSFYIIFYYKILKIAFDLLSRTNFKKILQWLFLSKQLSWKSKKSYWGVRKIILSNAYPKQCLLLEINVQTKTTQSSLFTGLLVIHMINSFFLKILIQCQKMQQTLISCLKLYVERCALSAFHNWRHYLVERCDANYERHLN